MPTIKYLLQNGARSVVLATHLGRPNGQKKKKFSVRQIVGEVEKCLGRRITFLGDSSGPDVERACAAPANGTVFLLENLRFNIAEKGKGKKDGKKVKASKAQKAAFRKSLTSLADIYVNDAFGTCHRKHSSMVGVSLATRCAGFLIKKEINAFKRALKSPGRPYVAVMGGKKVEDKLPLIQNLVRLVDGIVITGGMAYTFMKYNGMKIGNSIFDKKGFKLIPKIMRLAREKGVTLYLPVDFVIADKFDANARVRVVTAREGVADGWMGLDVGPRSAEIFSNVIENAKTVVYNGPQGVFEMAAFEKGTQRCIQAMADATRKGAFTIVGGGDSAAACRKYGYASAVSHVSTGGGASLELLQGKVLPGLKALSRARRSRL